MLDCLLNNSTAALITVSIRNLGGNICEEKSPGLLNMAPHWSSKPCMTQVTGVRAPVLEQPTYTWEGDGGGSTAVWHFSWCPNTMYYIYNQRIVTVCWMEQSGNY